MRYPHLTHAPIVEALIDIQCLWGSELSHDQAIKLLEGIVAANKEEFPKMEHQILQEIALNTDPDKTSVKKVMAGFMLKSEDSLNVVQFRKNGFTFSRLTPYLSWEELRQNAKRLWEQYSNGQLGEISVTRIATRFINKVKVPFPLKDGDEYIKNVQAPLTQPKHVSQMISFVDQTVSIDSLSGATVGLIRAMQPVPPGGIEVDFVLDIDVFRQVTDVDSINNQLWNIIDNFHDVKNRIFFDAVGSAIVDKYR